MQAEGGGRSKFRRPLGKKASGRAIQGEACYQAEPDEAYGQGSKLVRICACEEYAQDALELHAPQLFCPVCQPWPAIRQLAATGAELFPGCAGEKVLAELRASGELKEWHGAGRPGAHSFRRGAARVILEAGASFSQLLRAGQWRSTAYQLYWGLGSEESGAVASILVETSGDK